MDNEITDCLKGKHDLIEVYRAQNIYDESHVVKWCRTCGAVVVDIEVDGKVSPGSIMKMIAPKSYKWINRRSKLYK